MMKVYLLTDPLLDVYGSATPAILIGKKLIKDNEVIIVSPTISKEIENNLKLEGLNIYNLNKRYRSNGSLLTLEGWMKNIKFTNGMNDELIINFSQCFINKTHIYYAQGPMAFALDDIYQEMSRFNKTLYRLICPFIRKRDQRFNKRLRENAQLFIAVSRYCVNLYQRWGIKVEDVIYPPLNTEMFKPSTSSPSENYVLTYIGKEIKYSVLDKIARKGVKIKGFGAKTPFIPSYILNNPNIEILGKISTEELIELYSNALYTLFPFTHEPFGYVPIESIACCTPVLTYNKQGPAESVINNINGWLVNNDNQIVEMAIKLWNNGYDKSMRNNCRDSIMRFDINAIMQKWNNILRTFTNTLC